jgi:FkbM family methyltransferase
MKRIVERALIRLAKYLNIDLLVHAHVQIGVGHNTYVSGEEYVINDLISNALKHEPSIVFDVGANIGEYANLIRSRFKNCTIHCFEPVPQNYKILTENVQKLDVHCHNVALGSQEGILILYRASGDEQGSMATAYGETITNIFTFVGEVNEEIKCRVTTLDDFCGDKMQEIDFLKIDVEGHELEVLKGATKLIKANKIKIIQFEFNEFNIFSKSFLWNFYELLPGYHFYRILPKNKLLPLGVYDSKNEIFRYQNILAVNKCLNYTYAD